MKKLSTKVKIIIAGATVIVALSAIIVPGIVKTNIDPPVGSTSQNYTKDINTL